MRAPEAVAYLLFIGAAVVIRALHWPAWLAVPLVLGVIFTGSYFRRRRTNPTVG